MAEVEIFNFTLCSKLFISLWRQRKWNRTLTNSQEKQNPGINWNALKIVKYSLTPARHHTIYRGEKMGMTSIFVFILILVPIRRFFIYCLLIEVLGKTNNGQGLVPPISFYRKTNHLSCLSSDHVYHQRSARLFWTSDKKSTPCTMRKFLNIENLQDILSLSYAYRLRKWPHIRGDDGDKMEVFQL